ncbi:efflux RND transporter permease subunit [Novosphingobium aquiterrae]|uniref:Efflux RND transporter permease subunit n=1 Tax=Novosphingobium aquiterrae TaxID=624388 RepID=A0ABV6PG68_9SPHN
MSLTRFAVRHWQLTLVAFLLAALLGVQSFLSIPRSVDPQVPFAAAITTAVLPGADAAEVEETVAKPIEDVLQGLDYVKEVSSSSSDGVAVISVEFIHGTNAEQALDRTIREVTAIRSQLPQGLTRLDFRRPRPTEAAVIQLALVSKDASWRRFEKYAGDLRDALNVVGGVRSTSVYGLPRPEVQILLDPGRMAEAQLASTAVVAAIQAGGIDLPAGAVHSQGRRLNVDAGGAYRQLDDIRAVLIRGGSGRLLRVGDVARVEWGEPEQLVLNRFNGQRAVFVAVKQKDNVSAPVLRDALISKVAEFRAALPPDMSLQVGFDQSNDIQRRLGELARDFSIALALVLITLLPLGFRASLVVMISIPLSLALGVFMLARFGFTLNQISISGFVISLGLLVDDSIVVTENIERHLRDGEEPEAAAIAGTREISAAVLGSTGVLMFAFLPIAFLPEGAGDFVRGLPVAVLSTVASSLLISLTIIPFIASRLLKRETDPHGNRFLRFITAGIERLYQPLLHRALDNPKKTLLGTAAACLLVFAAVPLIGFSLFPESDSPYFVVQVQAPEGSGIAVTDKAVRDVSAMLAQEPEITARMENVGRGNPQIFYNNIPREDDTSYGEIFVTMREWSPRESPRMIDRLRARLSHYPDAAVKVVRFENGPPIEAPVAIRVQGPELGMLKQLSAQIAQIMTAVPGLRDVHNGLAVDRVDLDLGIDQTKASLLNINSDAVRRAVRLALNGERASTLRDSEGDSYPVVVRYPYQDHPPLSLLSTIYVPTQAGGIVPLREIATPTLKSGPSLIRRFKLERSNTISADLETGYLSSKLNAAVVEKLGKMPFPPGYHWSVGGTAKAANESTSGLGGVTLLAIFGIFGVLVAEFGRFREVLVVAGVIPLGLVGGLIALLLTGNSMSFLASIGFVALIGIEIKNSILLVDFTTQLRARGLALREAIEKAGEIRFLPVLLTSVTAIGGMLPLALSGAPLYAPLAWVIIGGLVSSTLLSRIVTPVMYLLILRSSDKG